MSRSVRHSPFCKITTARSEKEDKQRASRKLRRACKQKLVANPKADLHGVGLTDPYTFAGDGKQHLSDPTGKIMRK